MSREELDSGSVNGNSSFWKDVAEEFLEERVEYCRIVEQHVSFRQINPGLITRHDSDTLRSMWNELTSLYQRARSNMVKSGTHDSDFSNFCKGKVDLLYLHFWVEKKPHLLNTVKGRPPDDIIVDTLQNSTSKNTLKEKNPRKRNHEEIELLREFANTFKKNEEKEAMEAEYVKTKLRIALENHAFHKEEQLTDSRRALNVELTEAIQTLGELRQQLRNEDDEDSKEDLREDIAFFKSGKKKRIKALLGDLPAPHFGMS